MPLKGYTIAFDLDGTLVDTAPDLVRALNVCMKGSSVPAIGTKQVRDLIGQGARALIERAFAQGSITPEVRDVDERLAHFLEFYSANIAVRSHIFDGTTDCLSTLINARARLSICTNKPELLARKLIQALDLTCYFDGIFCPENVRSKKPDAAHVLAAIAPAPPARAIMVGDSLADLQSGRAAGVPVILMSHGYSDPPAIKLGADMVLDHFSQVSKAVFRLFNQHPNIEETS